MAERTIPTSQNDENQVVKREITRHPETYITPLTDIYEHENGLHVLVDLPGIEKSGLKLNVENHLLTIEGQCCEREEDNRNYLLKEFEPINFYRQFELTDSVDQENITAELKNGVLNLFLPKSESLKPRNIEVKVS